MRGKVVFMSSSSQKKLLLPVRENKSHGQLNCVSSSSPSWPSLVLLTPIRFHRKFCLCALCPDPDFSVSTVNLSVSCSICFHITFFLFFPKFDPLLIHSVFVTFLISFSLSVPIETGSFAARLFVHACSHSCSCFLSSSFSEPVSSTV